MLVLQRWSRTYPAILLYSMISSHSGLPSMFFILLLDMVFACGSTDTASLHQSPLSTTSIYRASLLSAPASLSIGWSIDLQSTIWYLQALFSLFFLCFPSPPFPFSLLISPFLHLHLFHHLFIHVIIISAIVSANSNFFLVFSLTFPSRLFIILSSLFSLFTYIKMYHRALFIREFSAAFLSNPAFLWLCLTYHKHNISDRVTHSISDLIFIRSWKYKHPRVFGHVGRHLRACFDTNRIYIVLLCLFALYRWETHSSSIDVPQ